MNKYMTPCVKCGSLVGNAVLTSHESRCDGPPHICTAINPYTGNPRRAIHPDAVVVGNDSHSLDEADRMQCPHCNTLFWVEIAN